MFLSTDSWRTAVRLPTACAPGVFLCCVVCCRILPAQEGNPSVSDNGQDAITESRRIEWNRPELERHLEIVVYSRGTKKRLERSAVLDQGHATTLSFRFFWSPPEEPMFLYLNSEPLGGRYMDAPPWSNIYSGIGLIPKDGPSRPKLIDIDGDGRLDLIAQQFPNEPNAKTPPDVEYFLVQQSQSHTDIKLLPSGLYSEAKKRGLQWLIGELRKEMVQKTKED